MAHKGGESAHRWLGAGIALLLAVQVVAVTTAVPREHPRQGVSQDAAQHTQAGVRPVLFRDLLGLLFPNLLWPPHETNTPPTSTSTSTSTSSSTSTSTSTSSTSSTTTTTEAPIDLDDDSCGPTIKKADGTKWVCTFSDGFTGSTLDLGKWGVQTTLHTGYHSGKECFVDDPDNVALSGGTLKLTVRDEHRSFECKQGEYDRAPKYSTRYTSGMVTTFGKFSQAYGKFQVRAKLPYTKIKGLQTSFWLWPQDASHYGSWPMSGEIDFAEWYSEYSDLIVPYVHYVGDTNNVTNQNCKVTNVGDYHLYDVEWTPQSITISYDGKVCLVNTWSLSVPPHPAPFDQPFTLSLTQMLGIKGNANQLNTPLPATTTVDYVRIWR